MANFTTDTYTMKREILKFSNTFSKGIPDLLQSNYLKHITQWLPSEPVIHIDDSDVIKPNGFKFESLGIVRDGSASTSTKNVMQKGYHVTEASAMTSNGHPISIFSEIHSSKEKNFKSINTITFSAMERGAKLFNKATFVMDRGYDNNKMFLKLDELEQDYVIRLKKIATFFYTINGLRQQNFVIAEKEKSKHPFSIKVKIMMHIYHM
jgi:hypothetical protein